MREAPKMRGGKDDERAPSGRKTTFELPGK
jgi:hypothetical protein